MLSYILQFATTTLMLLYLAKDWESHKRSWRRKTVFVLIILIGFGGCINTWYTNNKILEDQNQIAALTKGIETANKSQEANTKQFVAAFDELSQKLRELQAQVRTTELQEKADQLKSELEATRKSLVSPKASLSFTFAKPDPDAPLIRAVTLPVKNDIVHLEFTVANKSDTPALDGELTLIICDECEFASEPEFFQKLQGQKNTHRSSPSKRILPKTELGTLSAYIRVPPNLDGVKVGVIYRCVNCIVPELEDNTGIVYFLDKSKISECT